ncbi:UNKNOWN [Stylonychia lemnae]|uniref:Uncharacterized protein n=1 Tax=Stylonychia lemnae TaxID=5949 RepID=A0A078AY85_STYLE|nr:UNKNOWN [Stylonychia lemnae]|eukprot:CDW86182.1 UNKNOWN [Stylonychia lemnae]
MKKLSKFIRNFDLFAQPIYITYKNDSNYRTVMGGLTALVFGFFLIWYIINEIIVMAKGGYSIQNQTNFIDTEADPQSYVINAQKLNIAVRLGSLGKIIKNNDSDITRYVRPQFLYDMNDDTDSFNKGQQNSRQISVVKCDEVMFPWFEKRSDINNYYCPELNSFEIYGQESSVRSKQLLFVLQKCSMVAANPTTECEQNPMYEQMISHIYADVAIMTEYFDSKDFKVDRPFKKYFSQQRRYLVEDNKQLNSYSIKQNAVSIQDQLISFFWQTGTDPSSSKYQFYEIRHISTQVYNSTVDRFKNLGVLNFKFSQDNQQSIINVQSQTITGLISNVGGFFSLINMILIYLLS